MERTNVWAKRAHSRDTRDSGDMKSEKAGELMLSSTSSIEVFVKFEIRGHSRIFGKARLASK